MSDHDHSWFNRSCRRFANLFKRVNCETWSHLPPVAQNPTTQGSRSDASDFQCVKMLKNSRVLASRCAGLSCGVSYMQAGGCGHENLAAASVAGSSGDSCSSRASPGANAKRRWSRKSTPTAAACRTLRLSLSGDTIMMVAPLHWLSVMLTICNGQREAFATLLANEH